MDVKTKKEIERRIIEEITGAEREIVRLVERTKPIAPDNAIGRLSRMEAIGAKSVSEAALAKARQKVVRLKSALANLDEPEFGDCIECGEPIPVGRILLMPEAKMCVGCAEHYE